MKIKIPLETEIDVTGGKKNRRSAKIILKGDITIDAKKKDIKWLLNKLGIRIA